jgi:CheY-like chemotaxis protein
VHGRDFVGKGYRRYGTAVTMAALSRAVHRQAMDENRDAHQFLVVDHNADTRFLLVKCLQRKFPSATIHEIADGEEAVAAAARPDWSAIVSHRTTEMLGVELVALFRASNPTVPIVMVSGIERTAPALSAGADRFLLYDEWLRVGTVVHDLIEARRVCPRHAPSENAESGLPWPAPAVQRKSNSPKSA